MSDNKSVVLNAAGKNVELPVHQGTLGAPCVDITRLPKETGMFTYDPGFGNTGACKSAITYLDGDAGILQMGGHGMVCFNFCLWRLACLGLDQSSQRCRQNSPSDVPHATRCWLICLGHHG